LIYSEFILFYFFCAKYFCYFEGEGGICNPNNKLVEHINQIERL
jgi:hypothetical protein